MNENFRYFDAAHRFSEELAEIKPESKEASTEVEDDGLARIARGDTVLGSPKVANADCAESYRKLETAKQGLKKAVEAKTAELDNFIAEANVLASSNKEV